MAIQSGTYPTKNAPLNARLDIDYLRQLALVINNLLVGKSQNTGEVILTANTTTTVEINAICSKQSVILLMPKSANAATAITTTYISDPESGRFTITHANNAQTDKKFGYIIVG